jgi:hypothetical protein
MKKNNVRKSQRSFFNTVAHDSGFHPTKEYSNWYKIKSSNFLMFMGGNKIMRMYNGCVKAIVATYPNICFRIKQSGVRTMWDDTKLHIKWKPVLKTAGPHPLLEEPFIASHKKRYSKAFHNKVALEHGFHPTKEYNNWYTFALGDILAFKGGRSIVELHQGYRNAIIAAYPEVCFNRKFGLVTKEEQRSFFNSVAHDIGFHPIDQLTMWNDLDLPSVMGYEGSFRIMSSHSSLSATLRNTYRQHYTGTGSRIEKVLQAAVADLFSSQKVLVNVKKEGGLMQISTTGKKCYLEIDVFVPNLKLAFEYQDPYHYTPTWFGDRSLDVIQQRDFEKALMMKELGITLVVVPCWWDKSFSRTVWQLQLGNSDLSCLQNMKTEVVQPFVKTLQMAYFPHLAYLI